MADAQDLKSWDRKKSCRFESDHRHQLQTLFGEGVTNSQTPSASKSASNFLTQEQPDKSPKVLRHDLLKRNWLCVWCS
jgi:hypothetical protein